MYGSGFGLSGLKCSKTSCVLSVLEHVSRSIVAANGKQNLQANCLLPCVHQARRTDKVI